MAEESSSSESENALQVHQNAGQDLEEHMVWRQNASLLYDLLALCDLDQTPQAVSWLPDVEDEPTKLVVGLRSKGSKASKLWFLELTCLFDNEASDQPWKTWAVPELGGVTGLGLKGMNDQPPLRKSMEFATPSDPNSIATCPSQSSVLAVKGSCGRVFIYDSQELRATLSEETPLEGYALEWSPSDANLLATDGNNGQLCLWDAQATSKLWSTKAHEGPLNDLCYSQQLVSAGEDRAIVIWDVRAKSKAFGFQALSEQLTVDWNLTESHLLLTGGKDGLVNIWDTRKVDTPLKSLKGHPGEVVQVKWCPQRPQTDAAAAASPTRYLASACTGGKIYLWNMDSDEPNEDGDAPEVLFVHSGHSLAMNDFGLAPLEDFLFCSVAEDSMLQLWQPAAFLMEESEDEQNGESAAKRQRTEANGETLGRVE